ncbi:hypothetical protein [Metabacillus fastidiosus]|uniref:hypothetical protein n=1 Tax=Metabacillus fastidiosus TaxID=1458 RepID=UPI003D27BEB7
MGKYRILLLLFSFSIIYLDVFVNKVTTSYFVSSLVFFSMLLYDYEKIKRGAIEEFDKLYSNIGAIVYAVLSFSYLILLIASFFEVVALQENKKALFFQLKLKIMNFPSFDFGIYFLILFIFVFLITFVEILRDNIEPKAEGSPVIVAEK